MTPATPSRLLAAPLSTTAINLSWSSLGTDTTAYLLERSTPSNGSFAQIASLPNTQTVYQDSGRTQGTHYYYRVRGNNGTASGSYSPEADAWTFGDTAVMIAAAIDAHEGESDPHATYLTQAEGDGRYDALNAASGAVSAHAGASDPHPTYLTQAEGDGLYDPLGSAGSPVTLDTTVGTLLGLTGQELSLDVQNANKVLAGPDTGSDAAPTFRSLVADDLPDAYLTQTVADGLYAPLGSEGTGDVVGPAGATGDNFAAFDSTTGKLLKDSGKAATDFADVGHTHAGVTASDVATTITAFDGILSAADDDVQKALDTLDDHTHAGGSAHTIEDETTPLTSRANLSFQGAGVTATDDAGNDATVVTIPGGGGGVARSGSTTDAHLAVWNGSDADSIKDGGAVPPAGDVVGPAGATDGHLALFDSTTGKLIKDGGEIPAAGVARSGATTDGHMAVWNGSSADSIKDGGAAGTGTIGGATGSTDNAVIRADGTGGVTIQASLMTVDDSGKPNIPSGQTYDINNSPHTHAYIGGTLGSTDNAVPRADSTGGVTAQGSLVTIDDSGTVNIPTGQTYSINNTPHTHAGGGASITEGAYGSIPGSPTNNDLYLATDTGVILHQASSAWVPWGPIGKLTFPSAVSGQATTLNNSGTMGSGDTSCVVTSATGFPAAPFFILIGTEAIRVGAKSGTTFSSLTRGYNGTSAASHADASAVTLQNWLWSNQGTSTVDQSYGPTIVKSQVAGGQTLRALYTPAPATPYTVTALVQRGVPEHINYLGCGIGFRENSSGKYLFLGPEEADGAFAFGVMRWASTTSYTTSYKLTGSNMGGLPQYWLQISDDGTNLVFRVSYSGLPGTWYQYYTNTRGNYFSSAPTELAMLLYQENGSVPSLGTFWSWAIT